MKAKNQTISPEARRLYAKGYTIRSAAGELGVSPGHLSLVLNGERKSKRLISRARALTARVYNARKCVTA